MTADEKKSALRRHKTRALSLDLLKAGDSFTARVNFSHQFPIDMASLLSRLRCFARKLHHSRPGSTTLFRACAMQQPSK